jgi:hypothetical protein
MKHTDWIPTRVLEFTELVKVWTALLPNAEKQTAFGWDPAECATAVQVLNAFLAAWEAYEGDQTTEKRLTRDEARNAAGAAMRDFANSSIRYNKKMSDEEKAHLGIHVRDTTPMPIGPPHTRPVIAEIQSLGGFRERLHFHDETTPESRAIPYGNNGCLINYTWGSERFIDYAALTKTKLLTRSPETITLPPEAERSWFSCAARWQNGKGELGPWSDVVYAVVT